MIEELPQKVCITGASGYVASHIMIKLLEQKFHVIGLTRNKSDFLFNHFDCLKKKTSYINNLEIIEYDNNVTYDSKNNTLENILFNCDYLIHGASPVILDSSWNEENIQKIINPATKYTEDILKASLKTKIKKVIFISSTITIYDGTKDFYGSNDWADESYFHDAYTLSKIKSEKIAWKIYEENKKWELVVFNPGRIIGPIIYNKIPESYCSIIEAIKLKEKQTLFPIHVNNYYSSFCDVRDVAEIIVGSLPNKKTSRNIISFEIKEFKDYCKVLHLCTSFRSLKTPPKGAVSFGFEQGDTDCALEMRNGVKIPNLLFIQNESIFEYENSFKKHTFIDFEKSVKDSINSMNQIL